MRKLVLLVCTVTAACLCFQTSSAAGGLIPSWESPSKKLGFYPISNEISFYKNVDDAGVDRGGTIQFVMINSFKLLTTFNFEFTADYNFDYTPGMRKDHYVELSLVKPVTNLVSLNYQRVISSFEPEEINQFGLRLSF